ncbi:MAG: DUF2179 domain-containing protein [Candidatus Acetothermia bacterium]|jgi:uncharacterized protein YebE (UPF0316 family)|nr:DUF2179 domain-containing protein [Candidatus Acetothermia bacterium]MDH7504676.1 DUF2179 domain-containing protein [Candidatus Acetothermia bacterium]
MNFLSFLDSGTVAWVLPLFIFLARIVDVSMGTVRVIFIARGLKLLAPLLGFVEVLVWLLAIGQIMQNLTNFVSYLAYASGFALGTFVGIIIEDKLSLGLVLFRIITQREAEELIEWLKSEHYGVTVVPAQGAKGPVRIIFTVVKRRDIPAVAAKIQEFNPHAFYSVEDVRFVSEGVFPLPRARSQRLSHRLLKLARKGK